MSVISSDNGIQAIEPMLSKLITSFIALIGFELIRRLSVAFIDWCQNDEYKIKLFSTYYRPVTLWATDVTMERVSYLSLLAYIYLVARPEAPSVIVAVVCGGLIYWIIHKVLILRRIKCTTDYLAPGLAASFFSILENAVIKEFGKEEANYKVQQNLDSDTVLHFDKVLILCPELLPPQTTDDDSDACLVAELLKKDRKYNRKNPTAAAFMAATLFSAAPLNIPYEISGSAREINYDVIRLKMNEVSKVSDRVEEKNKKKHKKKVEEEYFLVFDNRALASIADWYRAQGRHEKVDNRLSREQSLYRRELEKRIQTDDRLSSVYEVLHIKGSLTAALLERKNKLTARAGH
jgi:hypothetical protein